MGPGRGLTMYMFVSSIGLCIDATLLPLSNLGSCVVPVSIDVELKTNPLKIQINQLTCNDCKYQFTELPQCWCQKLGEHTLLHTGCAAARKSFNIDRGS